MIENIEVPIPSKFNKHSDIDDLALKLNSLYRKECNNNMGYPVDPEFFADCVLETSIIWENIDSPPDTIVLARCHPDNRNDSNFIISLNEIYRDFFEERKDIHRAATSHEIGHIILKHHDKLFDNSLPTLFDLGTKEIPYLHSTKSSFNSLSKDEIKTLCELALDGNATARDYLLKLNDKLEEEWMFWQAEHFAMCFLVPKDRLFEIFESNYDLTKWRVIYKLADDFGVSGSMMANRMKKCGAIEIYNKQIKHGQLFKQKTLL